MQYCGSKCHFDDVILLMISTKKSSAVQGTQNARYKMTRVILTM